MGVPPKNLGRWVNRQRLAFSQNRLCKVYKVKLLSVGLKLDIYEKKPNHMQSSDNEDDDYNAIHSTHIISQQNLQLFCSPENNSTLKQDPNTEDTPHKIEASIKEEVLL